MSTKLTPEIITAAIEGFEEYSTLLQVRTHRRR